MEFKPQVEIHPENHPEVNNRNQLLVHSPQTIITLNQHSDDLYELHDFYPLTHSSVILLFCRFMNSRARPGQAYEPTKFEHIANMVTHGVSLCLNTRATDKYF